MIEDFNYELPEVSNPLRRLATDAAREIAQKIETAIAKALGERLELGRPATVDDMKGIAHRMIALHMPEARWYYLDREPLFGCTTLKVVHQECDWSEDRSFLGGKITLESHSLPLEDAPPVPRGWPVATFQLDRPIEPPADA